MSYFKDSDFKKMRWRVYKAKSLDDTGLSEVTELRRIKTNKLKVASYFALMYDAASPLPKRIQDIKERKSVAAKLAGFDLTQMEEFNSASQLFALSNDAYISIVVQMLKIQHNRDFSRISALERFFDECVEKMFSVVEESDKVDTKKMLDAMTVKDGLRKFMKSTSEELESLYSKIYGDDKHLEELVSQRVNWSPELVADLTSEIEEDEW